MRDDIKALRRSAATLTIISMFVIAYFARDLILWLDTVQLTGGNALSKRSFAFH